MQDINESVPIDYIPLTQKTTYRIGNRSFVVETVFKEESSETLGSLLLRLMKADIEK